MCTFGFRAADLALRALFIGGNKIYLGDFLQQLVFSPESQLSSNARMDLCLRQCNNHCTPSATPCQLGSLLQSLKVSFVTGHSKEPFARPASLRHSSCDDGTIFTSSSRRSRWCQQQPQPHVESLLPQQHASCNSNK